MIDCILKCPYNRPRQDRSLGYRLSDGSRELRGRELSGVLPARAADSGVYRPIEARRFVMMTMGGYWPVIRKLPNGHLGVVTRDGDFHIGERGRLVFVTSPDSGESWSHAAVISGDGSDKPQPRLRSGRRRGPARLLHRGCELHGRHFDRSKGLPRPLYLSRSEDNGATWSTSPPFTCLKPIFDIAGAEAALAGMLMFSRRLQHIHRRGRPRIYLRSSEARRGNQGPAHRTPVHDADRWFRELDALVDGIRE